MEILSFLLALQRVIHTVNSHVFNSHSILDSYANQLYRTSASAAERMEWAAQ